AKTHDVYLGTSLEDVTAATRTDLRGVLASQNQDANTYPVGRLAFGQTYYWRVDEVNAPPTDSTLFQGDVWRFTTEPYAYPVKPILAKASSSFNASLQPIKTIDGSGLNEYDGHSTTQTHMWLSGKTPQPPWVEYEFDQVYKLHEMWVWNQNQAKEVANLGYGARDVTITYSTDGTNWTALPDVPEFAQGTAEPNYLHNTTVSFGGALARVVRLTINSNWGSATKQAGLSEVRFFQAPLYARAPQPAPGATDVSLDSTLYWRTGREAAQHAVYLGTDSNEVLNGTAPVRTVAENRVPLTSVGAEYDRTYYWRVDEVNSAAAVQSWPGQEVWSFATTPYSVVDDFESYTEEKGNHIYEAWVDGWDSGGTNGSVVGNPDVEMAIVHGGGQSMPFSYDSTAGASVSEATRTFDTPQDWTQGGVRTLVLFFRGEWDNGIGQLYVRINDTQVSYAGDTQAMARPLWKQWNIDLASLPGLQAVRSVTLGVSGAVRGKLYVDDLRLYRAAPEVPSPVDPGTAGLAASYSFEGDVKDGSGHKLDGTAVNDPRYVDSLSGLGKAIELDGVNDHVVLPIGTVISTLTSTTIATWVNFDTGSTGQWQRVFDFGTYSVDVNGVSDPNFYMFLSPRILTNGVIRFGITTNGNAAGAESIVSSLNMMPGGWSHLAVVIEAGADANTVQVYLNGDVVARGTTATLPRDLGVTDQNWLGRSQYDADGYLGAGLDEFRIYDRALSPAEIRYLAGDR
ncbi:MAG: discoidin domain-containing protein, partial [Phycisphaerae bacterium]|nr:discoidin domain-containing protein [Phycisphaerae bacterium]